MNSPVTRIKDAQAFCDEMEASNHDKVDSLSDGLNHAMELETMPPPYLGQNGRVIDRKFCSNVGQRVFESLYKTFDGTTKINTDAGTTRGGYNFETIVYTLWNRDGRVGYVEGTKWYELAEARSPDNRLPYVARLHPEPPEAYLKDLEEQLKRGHLSQAELDELSSNKPNTSQTRRRPKLYLVK